MPEFPADWPLYTSTTYVSTIPEKGIASVIHREQENGELIDLTSRYSVLCNLSETSKLHGNLLWPVCVKRIIRGYYLRRAAAGVNNNHTAV